MLKFPSSNGQDPVAHPLPHPTLLHDERCERRAWSLFGHLVAEGVLPLPTFDTPNHEQGYQAALIVHGHVCAILEWLQRPEND